MTTTFLLIIISPTSDSIEQKVAMPFCFCEVSDRSCAIVQYCPHLALHSPPRSPVAQTSHVLITICATKLGFPGNGLGAARPVPSLSVASPKFSYHCRSLGSQLLAGKGLNRSASTIILHANYTTPVMLSKKVRLTLCGAGLPTFNVPVLAVTCSQNTVLMLELAYWPPSISEHEHLNFIYFPALLITSST